ncbi:MAG: hypothetical protein MRY79_06225 [Alphaproteobacteria bacterium]|nr:hypothetical protein [Alphaproteobacteria bacterium]
MNILVKKSEITNDSDGGNSLRAVSRPTPEQKQAALAFFENLSHKNASLEQLENALQVFSKSYFTLEENMTIIRGLLKHMKGVLSSNAQADDADSFKNITKARNLVDQYWGKKGQGIVKAIARSENLTIDTLDQILEFHCLYGFQMNDDAIQAVNKKIENEIHGLPLKKLGFIARHAVAIKLPLSPEFQKSLLEKIKRSSRALRDPRTTVPLAWSLAALDSIFPTEQYRKIAKMIRKPCGRIPSPTRIQEQQLRDIDFWFGWDQRDLKFRASEVNSKQERALAKFFNDAGYETTKLEQAIPFFKKAIDFTILGEKEQFAQKIHIELDGPSHYLINGNTNDAFTQLNGNTIFRSGLTNKAAPDERVVRIPANIARMMIKQSQSSLAKQFMNHASRLEPGVYHLQLKSEKVQGSNDTPFVFEKIAGDNSQRLCH